MDVADFYSGRSVFITGSTGFMGKVLIEKLLRSCPGINKIYALIRPGRKGESGQQRLDKLHSLVLFDRLKVEQPGHFESKLIAIEGDMCKEDLGLSIADRNLLIKEVSIVYHVAATVRFDQVLQEAIIMNVRGTKYICELVLDIRKHNPETILVHLSTAFAHIDHKVIEEKMYPPHADWRSAIVMAEELDNQTIQILSDKYKSHFPNTYTFTKSMAEDVVNDLCGVGGLTVIVRPSIVTASYQEPFAGWVDNLNGPVGILTAISTGIVRIIFMEPKVSMNYVPVDTAIKLMLLATWRQYIAKRNGSVDLSKVKIYNCSFVRLSITDMFEIGNVLIWKLQLNDSIWFPSFALTSNYWWFYVNFMLFQLLPAIVIDKGLSLISKPKRSLVNIQRKIYVAFNSLAFFVQNEWDFEIKSAMRLENYLSEGDLKTFGYDLENYTSLNYFYDACKGVKKYVMKESIGDPKIYLKKCTRMYYLDYFVKIIAVGLSISLFYKQAATLLF